LEHIGGGAYWARRTVTRGHFLVLNKWASHIACRTTFFFLQNKKNASVFATTFASAL